MSFILVCADNPREHAFTDSEAQSSWQYCPICRSPLNKKEVCTHEEYRKSNYQFCPRCGIDLNSEQPYHIIS